VSEPLAGVNPVTVAEFPEHDAEAPSMLVIPVKTSEAEALLRATAVVPMYMVEEFAELSPVFVPETLASIGTVNVFEVVPPATVNPTACDARVSPFTVDGVIAPSESVNAGVAPPLELPLIPFAVATDTAVTVPEPFPLNRLQSELESRPRFVAEAVGILKEWTVVVLEIVKSVPVVVTEKVCDAPDKPFSDVRPAPEVTTAEHFSRFVVGSHRRRVGVLLPSSVTPSIVATLLSSRLASDISFDC